MTTFSALQIPKPKTRGAWFYDPDALERFAGALKARAALLRAQAAPKKAKGAPGANPISNPDEDASVFSAMNALHAAILDGRYVPAEENRVTRKGWKRPVARELAVLAKAGKVSRAGRRKDAKVDWTEENLMDAYKRHDKIWTEHLASHPGILAVAAVMTFSPPPRDKKSSVD